MLASVTRTVVPLLVGLLGSWGVTTWLGITDDQAASAVTIVVTAVYYVAVRFAEEHAPQFGWLLGYASAPQYGDPATGPARQFGQQGQPGDGGQAWVPAVVAAAVVIVVLVVLAALGAFGLHL